MIGIVGGTFDPVHNGHLLPVHRLSEDAAFDRVHYVLCARPPHREPPVVSIEHRYRMLEIALDPFPLFVPDDREIRRPGPSYTVDTLIEMRRQYGDLPLCLVLGLDAYQCLESWHRWREIGEMANILVMSRPGWPPGGGIARVDFGSLRERSSGLTAFWDGVELPISSTRIRERLGARGDVSDQVPQRVLRYIQRNRLYGAGNDE